MLWSLTKHRGMPNGIELSQNCVFKTKGKDNDYKCFIIMMEIKTE